VALLTSSLLLAAGAALARPDCADWNAREFFEEATAADVARCISQGADPKAAVAHAVAHSDADDYRPTSWPDSSNTYPYLWRSEPFRETWVFGVDKQGNRRMQWYPVRPPAAPKEEDVTPLHWVARWRGNPEVAKVLLDAGTDPNARDKDGLTALHSAALLWAKAGTEPDHQRIWEGVVKALLDTGADSKKKIEGILPVDFIDELTPSDSPPTGH